MLAVKGHIQCSLPPFDLHKHLHRKVLAVKLQRQHWLPLGDPHFFFLAYLPFLIFPTTMCVFETKEDKNYKKRFGAGSLFQQGQTSGKGGELTWGTNLRPAGLCRIGLEAQVLRGAERTARVLLPSGLGVLRQEGWAGSRGPRAGRPLYLCSAGSGGPGEGGTGAGGVHGAVMRHVQGPVEVFHIHQRIQCLGLCRAQHVGLHAIGLAQLGDPEESN